MLASRHDEVWMLNQLARARMEATDQLSGPALVNRWGLEFKVGDRIVVRDNWYAHSDLHNGQTGTVIAVNPKTGSLSFRRDVDRMVIELPKQYLNRSVDHGYAQTIHTAQGQTFEITHVYADAGVKAEHGYTALSRARGDTHIWINDAPGSLSECLHVQGDPLTEDRIDLLVCQLSQSVIEPPAVDQGLGHRDGHRPPAHRTARRTRSRHPPKSFGRRPHRAARRSGPCHRQGASGRSSPRHQRSG